MFLLFYLRFVGSFAKNNKKHMVFLVFVIQMFIFAVLYARSTFPYTSFMKRVDYRLELGWSIFLYESFAKRLDYRLELP